jgi:hypothetical protein
MHLTGEQSKDEQLLSFGTRAESEKNTRDGRESSSGAKRGQKRVNFREFFRPDFGYFYDKIFKIWHLDPLF